MADKIAAHIIMVGRYLDSDPELAVQHGKRAYDLAPRVPAIREIYALAAYRAGDWRAAIREARTVRRMRGDDSWLPIIADCERGLGRPERAVAQLSDLPGELDDAVLAEAGIVLSGAQHDLGDEQAALAAFDDGLLRTGQNQVWAARYRYAYSEQLRRMGEVNEANKWLQLAIATDPDNETGALDRLEEVAPGLA
ncbi:MAG: Replicase polyprotein 1ab [Actinobacteria bacterium]|nr:Replicase polyprotein 1ab [Actinomycetota bacterium]